MKQNFHPDAEQNVCNSLAASRIEFIAPGEKRPAVQPNRMFLSLAALLREQ